MRVQQVLANLLVNAVKSTERGEVELSAHFTRDDGGNTGTLHVSVRDTGIGISREGVPGSERRDLRVRNATVIDDTARNCRLLEHRLRDWDIRVQSATDGITGLLLLERNPDADVVIVDYEMPFMNGLEVGRKMRRYFPLIENRGSLQSYRVSLPGNVSSGLETFRNDEG